ncbi:MAG: BolA family protein [Hyphomicrobium sp.]
MGGIRDEIERRLQAAFAPTRLQVIDESDRHVGHAGHDGLGESHFAVEMESHALAQLGRVERQRAVHRELADLLEGRVHALRLKISQGEG